MTKQSGDLSPMKKGVIMKKKWKMEEWMTKHLEDGSLVSEEESVRRRTAEAMMCNLYMAIEHIEYMKKAGEFRRFLSKCRRLEGRALYDFLAEIVASNWRYITMLDDRDEAVAGVVSFYIKTTNGESSRLRAVLKQQDTIIFDYLMKHVNKYIKLADLACQKG